MSNSKLLLRVLNLGKRSFGDALKTQELCRQHIIQQIDSKESQRNYPCLFTTGDGVPSSHGTAENILLLVEHWPVFTAGLRDTAFTEKDEVRLKAMGAEVFRTNRGGLATYHGPGQLVVYPIIDLRAFNMGLRKYVETLELTLVDTCNAFGVSGKTTKDTGVWVGNRKIASVGVNARRHVTMHGAALNCSTDLKWFDHIRPCGLEGVEMTSLSKEKGVNVSVSEAVRHFLLCFAQRFDCDISIESEYVPALMHKASMLSTGTVG